MAAQSLARRMLGDQGLELTHQRLVAAERQVGLDAVLDYDQMQLVEPGDLVLSERLVGEVGQGRPATEFERPSQVLGGAVRVALVERLTPLSGEALEAVGVHLIGIDLERVAAAAGDEHALAELLAKPRDVDLNGLDRRVRRSLAPEFVGDPVGRDDLAPVNEQDRQHRPLSCPT